jgi:hypothetical protein
MRKDSHTDNDIACLPMEELRRQWARCWGIKPHWRIGRKMLEKSLAFKQREARGDGMTPQQRKRLNNLVAQYKRDPNSFDQGPSGLKPGTKLVRAHQGHKHIVFVKPDGFEYRKQHYDKVRSVIKLIEILHRDGDKTKAGNYFTRGMLYFLLANPLYIGKIKHKSKVYDGHHKPIISQKDWSAAQEVLARNAAEPRGKSKPRQQHLLRGILFDAQGTIYSPVFTNKNGQRYRYYVSRDKIQNRTHLESIPLRIPAQEIEVLVEKGLRGWFADHRNLGKIAGKSLDSDHDTIVNLAARIKGLSVDCLLKTVSRIVVGHDTLSVRLGIPNLKNVLYDVYGLNLKAWAPPEDAFHVEIPFKVRKSWHGAVVIRPPETGTPEDFFDLPSQELRDLIRGFIWRDEHFNGMTIREIAKRDKRSDAFVGGMIRKTLEIA